MATMRRSATSKKGVSRRAISRFADRLIDSAAALVGFAFNAGTGAFRQSTLLRKLNAGEYDAVPFELAKWNKTTIAGRRVVSPGLVNRRAAEAGLWVKGDFVTSASVPVDKPPTAPKPAIDAAALGGVAAAAATAAPALTALSGVPPIVGAVLVGGLVVLAAVVLLTRQRRA